MLLEPWHSVRSNWEEHGKFLFRKFSSVYRVLQEATFANDEGVLGTDSLLAEVDRRHCADNTRRPLRMFQKSLDDTHEEREGSGSSSSAAASSHQSSGAGTSKEQVCEMMNRKNFMDCVLTVHPNLTEKQIDTMFDEALDLAFDQVLRSLDLLWRRYVDEASNYIVQTRDGMPPPHHPPGIGSRHGHRVLGTNREFFYNTKTNISQWTRPYHARMFRIQDIEMDSFVQIMIRKDLFPQRLVRCIIAITLHLNVVLLSVVHYWNSLIYLQKICGPMQTCFISKLWIARNNPNIINN